MGVEMGKWENSRTQNHKEIKQLIFIMRKLSDNSIKEIVERYQTGDLVTLLADEYCVSKLTIYYHLRRNSICKKVEHPKCYADYLKNEIFRIEENIKNDFYKPEKVKFAESHARRLRGCLKRDIKHKSVDAFILQ